MFGFFFGAFMYPCAFFFVCRTSRSLFPNYFFSIHFFIHLQPKIKAIMLQNEYELNHIFMTTVSVGEIKTLQHIQMMQWSQPWLRASFRVKSFPLFFSLTLPLFLFGLLVRSIARFCDTYIKMLRDHFCGFPDKIIIFGLTLMDFAWCEAKWKNKIKIKRTERDRTKKKLSQPTTRKRKIHCVCVWCWFFHYSLAKF